MVIMDLARGHSPSKKKIELSRILYIEVSVLRTRQLYGDNTYSAHNGDSAARPRELWQDRNVSPARNKNTPYPMRSKDCLYDVEHQKTVNSRI